MDIEEKNDWIATTLTNPNADFNDFKELGFNENNITILPIETYKKLPKIKEIKAFQNNEGDFDEEKFNNYYNWALTQYNYFIQDNTIGRRMYQKKADPSNYLIDPSANYNVNPSTSIQLIRNPFIGSEIQSTTMPGSEYSTQLSAREIAQTRPVFNRAKGTFEAYSPNSFATFVFGPLSKTFDPNTYVLALYDETDDLIEVDPVTGKEVEHKVGELKRDKSGSPYYETNEDRSVVNRQVLHTSDVLTVDGSLMNSIDIFDADGVDASVFNSVAKTIFELGLMLYPSSRNVIMKPLLAKEIVDASAGLIKAISESDTDKEQNTVWKTANWISSKSSEFDTSISDYGQQNMWSLETWTQLLTDIPMQLYEQRYIAEKLGAMFAPKIITDRTKKITNKLSKEYSSLYAGRSLKADILKNEVQGDFLKHFDEVTELADFKKLQIASSEGARLSKLYMALILADEVNNTMEQQGFDSTSRTVATVAALAAFMAMFSYTSLGDVALIGMGFDEFQDMGKKLTQQLIKTANSIDNKLISREATNVGILTANKSALQTSFNVSTNFYKEFLAKPWVSSSIREMIEEVSEEMTMDAIIGITKKLRDQIGWSSKKDQRIWLNTNPLERYIMSAIGGFMGGGLFHGFNNLSLKLSGELETSLSEDTVGNLLYAISNGYTDKLLNEIDEAVANQQTGASNTLSFESEESTADGTPIYLPAKTVNGVSNSQNYMLGQYAKAIVMALSSDLNESGYKFTNAQIYERALAKQKKMHRLLSSGMHLNILQDFFLNQRQFIIEQAKLKQLIASNASEVEITQKLNLVNLYKQNMNNLLDGNNLKIYTLKLLFFLSPQINNAFFDANINMYAIHHGLKLTPENYSTIKKMYEKEYNAQAAKFATPSAYRLNQFMTGNFNGGTVGYVGNSDYSWRELAWQSYKYIYDKIKSPLEKYENVIKDNGNGSTSVDRTSFQLDQIIKEKLNLLFNQDLKENYGLTTEEVDQALLIAVNKYAEANKTSALTLEDWVRKALEDNPDEYEKYLQFDGENKIIQRNKILVPYINNETNLFVKRIMLAYSAAKKQGLAQNLSEFNPAMTKTGLNIYTSMQTLEKLLEIVLTLMFSKYDLEDPHASKYMSFNTYNILRNLLNFTYDVTFKLFLADLLTNDPNTFMTLLLTKSEDLLNFVKEKTGADYNIETATDEYVIIEQTEDDEGDDYYTIYDLSTIKEIVEKAVFDETTNTYIYKESENTVKSYSIEEFNSLKNIATNLSYETFQKESEIFHKLFGEESYKYQCAKRQTNMIGGIETYLILNDLNTQTNIEYDKKQEILLRSEYIWKFEDEDSVSYNHTNSLIELANSIKVYIIQTFKDSNIDGLNNITSIYDIANIADTVMRDPEKMNFPTSATQLLILLDFALNQYGDTSKILTLKRYVNDTLILYFDNNPIDSNADSNTNNNNDYDLSDTFLEHSKKFSPNLFNIFDVLNELSKLFFSSPHGILNTLEYLLNEFARNEYSKFSIVSDEFINNLLDCKKFIELVLSVAISLTKETDKKTDIPLDFVQVLLYAEKKSQQNGITLVKDELTLGISEECFLSLKLDTDELLQEIEHILLVHESNGGDISQSSNQINILHNAYDTQLLIGKLTDSPIIKINEISVEHEGKIYKPFDFQQFLIDHNWNPETINAECKEILNSNNGSLLDVKKIGAYAFELKHELFNRMSKLSIELKKEIIKQLISGINFNSTSPYVLSAQSDFNSSDAEQYIIKNILAWSSLDVKEFNKILLELTSSEQKYPFYDLQLAIYLQVAASLKNNCISLLQNILEEDLTNHKLGTNPATGEPYTTKYFKTEDENQLKADLNRSVSDKIIIVNGDNGTGKTQIVAKYANLILKKLVNDIDYRVWVSAPTEKTTTKLAEILNITDKALYYTRKQLLEKIFKNPTDAEIFEDEELLKYIGQNSDKEGIFKFLKFSHGNNIVMTEELRDKIIPEDQLPTDIYIDEYTMFSSAEIDLLSKLNIRLHLHGDRKQLSLTYNNDEIAPYGFFITTNELVNNVRAVNNLQFNNTKQLSSILRKVLNLYESGEIEADEVNNKITQELTHMPQLEYYEEHVGSDGIILKGAKCIDEPTDEKNQKTISQDTINYLKSLIKTLPEGKKLCVIVDTDRISKYNEIAGDNVTFVQSNNILGDEFYYVAVDQQSMYKNGDIALKYINMINGRALEGIIFIGEDTLPSFVDLNNKFKKMSKRTFKQVNKYYDIKLNPKSIEKFKKENIEVLSELLNQKTEKSSQEKPDDKQEKPKSKKTPAPGEPGNIDIVPPEIKEVEPFRTENKQDDETEFKLNTITAYGFSKVSCVKLVKTGDTYDVITHNSARGNEDLAVFDGNNNLLNKLYLIDNYDVLLLSLSIVKQYMFTVLFNGIISNDEKRNIAKLVVDKLQNIKDTNNLDYVLLRYLKIEKALQFVDFLCNAKLAFKISTMRNRQNSWDNDRSAYEDQSLTRQNDTQLNAYTRLVLTGGLQIGENPILYDLSIARVGSDAAYELWDRFGYTPLSATFSSEQIGNNFFEDFLTGAHYFFPTNGDNDLINNSIVRNIEARKFFDQSNPYMTLRDFKRAYPEFQISDVKLSKMGNPVGYVNSNSTERNILFAGSPMVCVSYDPRISSPAELFALEYDNFMASKELYPTKSTLVLYLQRKGDTPEQLFRKVSDAFRSLKKEILLNNVSDMLPAKLWSILMSYKLSEHDIDQNMKDIIAAMQQKMSETVGRYLASTESSLLVGDRTQLSLTAENIEQLIKLTPDQLNTDKNLQKLFAAIIMDNTSKFKDFWSKFLTAVELCNKDTKLTISLKVITILNQIKSRESNSSIDWFKSVVTSFVEIENPEEFIESFVTYLLDTITAINTLLKTKTAAGVANQDLIETLISNGVIVSVKQRLFLMNALSTFTMNGFEYTNSDGSTVNVSSEDCLNAWNVLLGITTDAQKNLQEPWDNQYFPYGIFLEQRKYEESPIVNGSVTLFSDPNTLDKFIVSAGILLPRVYFKLGKTDDGKHEIKFDHVDNTNGNPITGTNSSNPKNDIDNFIQVKSDIISKLNIKALLESQPTIDDAMLVFIQKCDENLNKIIQDNTNSRVLYYIKQSGSEYNLAKYEIPQTATDIEYNQDENTVSFTDNSNKYKLSINNGRVVVEQIVTVSSEQGEEEPVKSISDQIDDILASPTISDDVKNNEIFKEFIKDAKLLNTVEDVSQLYQDMGADFLSIEDGGLILLISNAIGDIINNLRSDCQ